MVGTLVFIRHGQSQWNASGQFTGWVDVDLTAQGVEEAQFGAELIGQAGIQFDVMYTSVLKRAIKTGQMVLNETNQHFIPVVKTWRLNERMYGALQGLNKVATVEEHGKPQVLIWRRSFDVPPPEIDVSSEYWPGHEVHKYGNLALKDIPRTECLKDVIERVVPFWESEIMRDLREGKNVLVAAHGNSIRAICKYLDNIPDDVIPSLEIPTGIPLVYELDEDLNPILSDRSVAPLNGYFLISAEELKERQEAVKNQLNAKPVATENESEAGAQNATGTPTLYYLNVRARCECIEMIAQYSQFSYEKETIPVDDGFKAWGAVKPTMPSGQVPALRTTDGTLMGESVDIAMYVAANGGCEEDEKLLMDEAQQEFLKMSQTAPLASVNPMVNIFAMDDEETKAKIQAWTEQALPVWKEIEERLVSSGGPFLGGSAPGVGDLALLHAYDVSQIANPEIFADFGETFTTWVETTKSLPGVSGYLESRPRLGQQAVGKPGSLSYGSTTAMEL